MRRVWAVALRAGVSENGNAYGPQVMALIARDLPGRPVEDWRQAERYGETPRPGDSTPVAGRVESALVVGDAILCQLDLEDGALVTYGRIPDLSPSIGIATNLVSRVEQVGGFALTKEVVSNGGLFLTSRPAAGGKVLGRFLPAMWLLAHAWARSPTGHACRWVRDRWREMRGDCVACGSSGPLSVACLACWEEPREHSDCYEASNDGQPIGPLPVRTDIGALVFERDEAVLNDLLASMEEDSPDQHLNFHLKPGQKFIGLRYDEIKGAWVEVGSAGDKPSSETNWVDLLIPGLTPTPLACAADAEVGDLVRATPDAAYRFRDQIVRALPVEGVVESHMGDSVGIVGAIGIGTFWDWKNLLRPGFGEGMWVRALAPDKMPLGPGPYKIKRASGNTLTAIDGIVLHAQDWVPCAAPEPEPTEGIGSQVDRLANFIMAEIPGEPSESDGAVDTAIRLLRQRKPPEVLPNERFARTALEIAALVNSGEVEKARVKLAKTAMDCCAKSAAHDAPRPAEVLYMFMGWLTSRDRVTGPFSSRHEGGQAAELIAAYQKHQGWEQPRDRSSDWPIKAGPDVEIGAKDEGEQLCPWKGSGDAKDTLNLTPWSFRFCDLLTRNDGGLEIVSRELGIVKTFDDLKVKVPWVDAPALPEPAQPALLTMHDVEIGDLLEVRLDADPAERAHSRALSGRVVDQHDQAVQLESEDGGLWWWWSFEQVRRQAVKPGGWVRAVRNPSLVMRVTHVDSMTIQTVGRGSFCLGNVVPCAPPAEA